MGRYKGYAEYRESGVEWIGLLPKEWAVLPLKRSLKLVTERAEQKSNPVGLENIESWSARFNPTETEFEGTGIAFREGDILFGKLRPYLAKAYLAKFEGEAIGDFHVMRPEANCEGQYALYQILQNSFISVVDGATHGAKMPRVGWEFMGNIPFVYPSLEEQVQIAKFLDHETAKIDTLISKQERLIELLQEKRQAVISHAVTKGLDSSVPMKDSGVEWLGEVPEHWSVVKLSFMLRLQSGEGITSSHIETEGAYPVYGGNGLRGYTDKYNCEGSYVLIGRQGALCGNINVVENKFYASEHAVVVYPLKDFNITYLAEFLRFMNLGQYSVSAAQPGIAVDRINALPILVPPVSEQNSIGNYIENHLIEHGKADNLARRQIRLLQERRTALISAAVTGKIDVREVELS